MSIQFSESDLRQIVVEWEYWPKPLGGTQDDPISGKTPKVNILGAISLVKHLQEQHEDRLRLVTFTITVYTESKSQS